MTENKNKGFRDVMVGDKLYYADLDAFGIYDCRVTSIELDENALRDMDHRVPDVIFKTNELKDFSINKCCLLHFNNKVLVNEDGLYISPSRYALTTAITKAIDEKLNYWNLKKNRILNAYYNAD
jgi:effector-binding domain-containing protein